MSAYARFKQLGLVGRRQDQLGSSLALQAMRHDFPPHLIHEFRRGPMSASPQPIEDFPLTARPDLQVAIALGVLDCGDGSRCGKAPVDQVEDLIVH